MSAHVAMRTCVGCGQRERQAVLVRFAADGGRLVPRRAHGAAGRSAYLHRSSSCWGAFLGRRGPVRSLRMTPGAAERERFVAVLRADESSR